MFEDNFYPNGQVVIVTGGAGQLGSAICRHLDGLGNKVIMADLNTDDCDRKISLLKLTSTVSMKLDVTDESSIKAFFKSVIAKYKRIDCLINNAGISVFTPFTQRTFEEFDKVMKVNVYGTFFCSKYAIEIMERQDSGRIVNLGSIYGVVSPDPGIYGDSGRNSPEVYGASKAGIIQMTRYLACHVKSKNIRVNCVSPGGIYNKQKPVFVANYKKKTPVDEMADEDQIAQAIIFLMSKASGYINGHNLVVDGGFSAW